MEMFLQYALDIYGSVSAGSTETATDLFINNPSLLIVARFYGIGAIIAAFFLVVFIIKKLMGFK